MPSLANVRISRRLALGFSLMVALLIGVVAFSLSRLNTINHQVNRITGERMQRMEAIQVLVTDVNGFSQAAETAVVATGDAGKKAMDTLAAKVKTQGAAIVTDTEGDNEAARQFAAARGAFEASVDKLVKLLAAGDSAQALDELLGGFGKARQGYAETLGKLRDAESQKIAQTRDSIGESYAFAFKVMVAASIFALLLAVLIAVTLTRSVTVPLEEVLRATEDLRAGEGDLTFRVPTLKAEFGLVSDSLNGFIKKLHDIIATVAGAAQSVNVAAREIATGHGDLSKRTERQAVTLQSTATNVEELAGTVRNTAESTRQASQLAMDASAIAGKGGAVIERVVQSMNQISGGAKRVADIISVIDTIAFQTNILALNAAVEAARAGEQGRGFAVVASEVRALAQRSATAAREIKTLIEESLASVDSGSRAVKEAGETMKNVVEATQAVSRLVADVSVAADEQSAGIGRLNSAVASMEEGSQHNAAMVHQAAAATASLEEQARALAAAVETFKLDIDQVPGTGGAQTNDAMAHVAAAKAPAQPVLSDRRAGLLDARL